MESSGENRSTSKHHDLVDIESKIKNHIKSLKILRDESNQHVTTTTGKNSSITPMDIFYFNQRVKSFQIATWFNKPFIVNPLQCARYGFTNVDTDKIECSQCKTRKLLKSSFDNIKISSDVLERRALDFCEELKTSHTPQCVFYNQPSPLRFTLFSHQDTSSGKNSNMIKIHCFEFHDLMKKFRKINKNLHINLSLDHEFVNEYFGKHSLIINRILDQMHIEEEEERALYTIFCWLSVFNWQISNNSDLPTLSCRHCQMNHYLKVKNNCLTSAENLNPHSMHRWWCPCIHVNKLSVDFEQIVENEDQSYIKTLTKRQLNEEMGWKQMLDSISSGLSSESEFSHIHKDSLENEFNAATLVKNILSNSISSVFESEKKRKDHLKSVYDKIYYRNEMQLVEPATLDMNTINQTDSTQPLLEKTDVTLLVHELESDKNIAPKEINQAMDTSDDDIEIDNSEIIIETNDEIPLTRSPKHALHQTTLDNYFHHTKGEITQTNENEPEPLNEEQPTLSIDASENPNQLTQVAESIEENIMADTIDIMPPSIDTTSTTLSCQKPSSPEGRANTTPSTPEESSTDPTIQELRTPMSALSSLSEFEDKTPKKMESLFTQTPPSAEQAPKTPFESSVTSPMSSTSEVLSPIIFKGTTTPSSESKQDNRTENKAENKSETKLETKPKPQTKPQTPSKSSSEDKSKTKTVASSPSTNKSASASKEEQSTTSTSHKQPYKSKESSSTSNRKPTQPRKPRETSSSSSTESSSRKPSQNNERNERNTRTTTEQNKRKKPSGYQSGNPKTKNNKR